MAHWAELDDNNIVIRVTVGNNDDITGDEGYQWLLDNLGGKWIRTSYNSDSGKHYKEVDGETIETSPGVFLTLKNRIESGQPHLRYNFAGPGYLYDPIRDAFIPPKPEDYVDEEGQAFTFALNKNTCQWEIISTSIEK